MVKIIDKKTIEKIINNANPNELIGYIENAFISFSNNKSVVPPVGTLTFQSPPGEVHIKYGYIKNEPNYVVKIASGFYENPTLGLASSNGLNLVFSQTTGELKIILLDEGYLTDIRTAIAGAIVAKYMAPKTIKTIGIVGSGIQARLQLRYLKTVVDCNKIIVWGRSKSKLLSYQIDMKQEGFDVEVTTDIKKLTQKCNLIITTTSSKSPIVLAKDVQRGTHITAVGADTLGKQELDSEILESADLIVLDSLKQCQSHGEIHKAFRDKRLVNQSFIELGEVILFGGIHRKENDISIADLTGIATQDIQISKFVLDNIK